MFNRLNCITVTYKSSHSQIFFRIGVLRNFAMFTGKHMCWSLILIKLQVLKNISDGCFCLKNTSVYNYNNSSSDHSSQYGSHLLIILSLSYHEQVCLIRLRLEIYFSHQPDNGGSFLET